MIKAMALLNLEIAKVRANVYRLCRAEQYERAVFRVKQARHLQEVLDLLEAEYYDREK